MSDTRARILLAIISVSFASVLFYRKKKLSTLSYDSNEVRELKEEDFEFITQWKGSQKSERKALENHVLKVWRDIKKVAHTYRCVQTIGFLTPKLSSHPAYANALSLSRAATHESKPFAWLDVGCAFGQNTRALVTDGVPTSQITAADIHDQYWKAGFELFGDAADNTAAFSLLGTHTSFGDWAVPLSEEEKGVYGYKFQAIVCMAVLHVLSKTQCETLLARLSACAAANCKLLGMTVGAKVEGEWARTPDGSQPRYLHSVESLKTCMRAAGWSDVEVHEEERAGDSSSSDRERVRLIFSATKF